MIFRCNPDGSELETLAHNFRNNYEVAVDSFGGLWQSDNDDDGYFGVRLNYILEYGNYGYREENTGAFWKEPRVSMHPEIPKRHWHQNDPGVIPNFVQTGAGSPTAITVYEGDLLPEIFQNQVIHCDAGPGVVWAAIAEEDGAGFRGDLVNLLKEAKGGWVRPVDVATAPDGSLFVTDWYDPIVGWNRQFDVPRGRIYRIAPKNHKYQVQALQLGSPTSAATAIKSPNSDVRFQARKALFAFDRKKSIAALQKVLHDKHPRIRARALWLLAELEEADKPSLEEAAKDPQADIRVTAIRAARQFSPELVKYLKYFTEDSSARVRSEVAIALRNLKTVHVPEIWTQLAGQLEANDRWNLEALGIAADGRWDTCLETWLASGADWKSPAGRKIIWRSRGKQTPELLEQLLNRDDLDMDEVRMLIRAFDFQEAGPEKLEALRKLAYNRWTNRSETAWLISSEAFQRLRGSVFSPTTQFNQQLNAFLDQAPVNEAFFNLVSSFDQAQHYPAILNVISTSTTPTLQSLALKALLDGRQEKRISQRLHGASEGERAALVQVLAESLDERAVPLLEEILRNSEFGLDHRKQATRALGASSRGAVALINLAKKNQFPEVLKEEAGAALTQTMHVRAYEEAARYFPLPKMKGEMNIPGMTDLVLFQGNKERGKQVFREAACATCHQINGEGIHFGPDLSAIGAKLAKTGLFDAILNPSASVSESYQTVTLKLKDGSITTGLLTNETGEKLGLLLPGGISRDYPRSNVSKMEKSTQSLMPSGLQRLMTVDDLVDLVEYLSALH